MDSVLKNRPAVLRHIFAAIHTNGVGVVFSVFVRVAVDLGGVDETLVSPLYKDLFGSYGFEGCLNIGDKVAEIGPFVLFPQNGVEFVDVDGGAFSVDKIGEEFFALFPRKLHGHAAGEHFKVPEAFDLQFFGRFHFNRIAKSVQFFLYFFKVDGFGNVTGSV